MDLDEELYRVLNGIEDPRIDALESEIEDLRDQIKDAQADLQQKDAEIADMEMQLSVAQDE